MARTLMRILTAALAIAGMAALAAGVWFVRRGISAKNPPGRFETTVARRVRTLAIPRSARDLQNPVQLTPEVIAAGLSHFADHCATCHANDGSGDTEMGRGLYPRAPDMRQQATQSLSDGSLFYIIENGVRLTGMPAWSTGTSGGAEASWHLVHFIRHLPQLTDDELEEMKTLNPKSPEEWQQQEEERRFLEGGSEPQPGSRSRHTHGGQQ
jgi:mono/diheme cytochrome c family protein